MHFFHSLRPVLVQNHHFLLYFSPPLSFSPPPPEPSEEPRLRRVAPSPEPLLPSVAFLRFLLLLPASLDLFRRGLPPSPPFSDRLFSACRPSPPSPSPLRRLFPSRWPSSLRRLPRVVLSPSLRSPSSALRRRRSPSRRRRPSPPPLPSPPCLLRAVPPSSPLSLLRRPPLRRRRLSSPCLRWPPARRPWPPSRSSMSLWRSRRPCPPLRPARPPHSCINRDARKANDSTTLHTLFQFPVELPECNR